MPTSSDVDHAAPAEFLIAESAFGKEVYVCRVPNTAMFSFKMSGGGKLPAVLQGTFTNMHAVNSALALWKNGRPVKS